MRAVPTTRVGTSLSLVLKLLLPGGAAAVPAKTLYLRPCSSYTAWCFYQATEQPMAVGRSVPYYSFRKLEVSASLHRPQRLGGIK